MTSSNPSPSPGRLSRATALTPAVRMGLSIAVATGLYSISFGALGSRSRRRCARAGIQDESRCAMTLWGAILLACAVTYLTKLAGYAVPARWLNNLPMARVAGAITVALLSALTVMNTFAFGTALVLDARLAALAAAALALWMRLPFLLVVVLGAGAAALVLLWGVKGR